MYSFLLFFPPKCVIPYTTGEKLNKHKTIQRKKEEIESGVWKVVPHHFIQFDYETLMQHTFGLHPQNNKDGITGFYEGRGKFAFIDKDGKLICLAYIEPEEEFYRVCIAYTE